MNLTRQLNATLAEVPCRAPEAHTVQFYSDDRFLLDVLSRFISGAIAVGDAAVILATPSHQQELAGRLRDGKIDLAWHVKNGRVLLVDACETLSQVTVDGTLNREKFAVVIGSVLAQAQKAIVGMNVQVAVFGELVTLLWAQGRLEEAVQVEKLWNELTRLYPFYLLCAYPLGGFNREVHIDPFLWVCAQHSQVLPSETYSGLDGTEEHLRGIAELEQKARVLETELVLRQSLMQTQEALRREILERRKVEERLRTSEKSLRRLSLHLLRTQDEERRRIGRDLHDSLGQALAVLKMKLDSLGLLSQLSGEVTTEIAQCSRLVEDSIREVRTISYLLYPPMLEEMGLKSAIVWYLDGFAERSGIATTFEVDPELGRLPREVELALFRVLQESLTNVHRHSGSKTAHISLMAREGCVVLKVEDKGTGIRPEVLEQSGQDGTGALGIGLRGMNERMQQLGGALELASTAQGATVSAVVPLNVTSMPQSA